MALYNKYFGYNEEQQEDKYHGEYDDNAYGSLYIPHIEEQLASTEEVKRVFCEQKIGHVTSVTFTELATPSTYKGKNKKKAYRAIIYLKWCESKAADALRQAIGGDNNKKKSQIQIDDKQHWVIHYNTAKFSNTLLEERCYNADTAETAMDMVFRVLQETEEELAMHDLDETAKDVAMRVLCA